MTRSESMTAKPSRRRILQGAAAVTAGLAAPTFLKIGSALAAYPDRPVKIVVANTPGGPSDIIARVMAAAMAEPFGGSVIVENRGGAGGNIGMGFAARAEPDAGESGATRSPFEHRLVQARLAALGLSAADAVALWERLTPLERMELAARADELETGGDPVAAGVAIAIIVAMVVILALELIGRRVISRP